MTDIAPTGAVYDRGYRPYDGERGGRTAARNALFRASIRRAFGIRRTWRQKVAPFGLLLIATVPAIVNVGVAFLTRNTPAERVEFITYRDYVGVSNALLVFVALIAPDLICPDRRNRVLPLIFARPLTGLDYVVAKLGAMVSIIFAFGVLPQAVLFIGQTLVNKAGPISYVRENAEVLWQVPLAVAVLALFYGCISIAMASLASRRITAGASIVGLFLVTSIVAGVLSDESLRNSSDGSLSALISLLAIPLQIRDVIFLGHIDPESPLSGAAGGGVGAVIVFAVCVVVSVVTLFIRYDEVER
jgi:ABC-2 type transport system permease protein